MKKAYRYEIMYSADDEDDSDGMMTSGPQQLLYSDSDDDSDGMMTSGHRKATDMEADLVPDMAALSVLDEFNCEVSIAAFKAMSPPMRSFIEEGRMYAVTDPSKDVGGGRRCARITFGANKQMYLHCLSTGPTPRNAIMVQYLEVLRLVDPSSRVAFLELGFGGSSLGKMQIRLLRDTPACRQFSALCTGETGPSYANTKLLEIWQRDGAMEYVAGGDYENNNGSGGKAMISGLGNEDEYNRDWKAGTVWGFLLWKSIAAQFFIITKDIPGMTVSAPAFGIVEDGLQVLTDAIQNYHNIQNVIVVNCGIVLPITL